MTLAMLCPGQGSQMVGMGRALLGKYSRLDDMLAHAGDRMGYDLAKAVKRGPARELQSTRVAQVAIFVFSAGVGRILSDAGVRFDVASGHSLGEISALHLAGAIGYNDALDLVIARAAAMEVANATNKGSMTAVIGARSEVLHEICAEAGVWVCNLNTLTQTVISGAIDALPKAEGALKSAGYRVTRLQVAGAYHSALMAPALPMFEAALNACQFERPSIPVISNVTGAVLDADANLRAELLTQVSAPVQWQACLDAMKARGVSEFVEVGFGKHMKGIALQAFPDMTCHLTSTPQDIDAVVNRFATSEALV